MRKLPLIIFMLFLAVMMVTNARSEMTEGKVNSHYDKFKDQTDIYLPFEHVEAKAGDSAVAVFAVIFQCEYAGTKPSEHQGVALHFMFNSTRGMEEGKKYDMIFLIDGKRQSFKAECVKTELTGAENSNRLTVMVPLSVISDIAGGKNVEGELDETEFKLSTDQIKAVGEMIKLIGAAK